MKRDNMTKWKVRRSDAERLPKLKAAAEPCCETQENAAAREATRRRAEDSRRKILVEALVPNEKQA